MNTRSVQNIHLVLTLGSNAGPISLLVFGQTVMLNKTNSQFQDNMILNHLSIQQF